MNITVIHGSPRKGRNSDTLAESFLKGINKTGEQAVNHFYTNEMDIRPCQGCEKCLSGLENFCITEDDMQKIYRSFIGSEIIVFATPMYWGYLTAQIKGVIDRMEAITSHFKGKTFVVLITYRHHYQSTVAFFERITPFFGVELHTVTCCTMEKSSLKDISITERPGKLQEAYKLGRKLAIK